MTLTILNKNLLIDNSKAPDHEKQGIIDIGKNCSMCNQLDFLPFVCEFCKHVYCSSHRTTESHHCTGAQDKKANPGSITYEGPSAASLFPDRKADKAKLESKLKDPKPTTILEKHFRVGDVAANTPNAFSKLNRFLKLQRSKKSSSSSTIGKLFGKKSSSSSSSSSRVAEVAILRKTAKGDTKIPVGDRIYVWCLYINVEESSDTEEQEKFAKINVEKDRKPVYISKNWPVGRALDSIADTLHIVNYNNSTTISKNRLNIFKLHDEQPVLIEANKRAVSTFSNGDVLYLVKGPI